MVVYGHIKGYIKNYFDLIETSTWFWIKQNQYMLIVWFSFKHNRTLGIEKMSSKEIYPIIMSPKVNMPTSQIYFENKFFLNHF